MVFQEPHRDAEHDDVGPVWDRLGDGGYVESSATLALTDLLRDLEASGRLKACKPEDDCAAQGILDRARVRLLLLVNSPSKVEDWLCRDAPPRPTRCRWTATATAPRTWGSMRSSRPPRAS